MFGFVDGLTPVDWEPVRWNQHPRLGVHGYTLSRTLRKEKADGPSR